MTEHAKGNRRKRNRRLQRAASYASLTVALVLIAAKLWSYMATNSVSILSSLVDSVLDMLASAITVVAIYYSLRPADREHRFGHGKAEGLAALLQSIIVTISAAYVLKEAADRIINPQTITSPLIGLGVMGLSIMLTSALVAFSALCGAHDRLTGYRCRLIALPRRSARQSGYSRHDCDCQLD